MPKKSLGQNYLIDRNICKKIVDAFGVSPDDCVVEIGAGKGALTNYLVSKAGNFVAVELDKNNAAMLSETFPGLKILQEDFLKTDLAAIRGILRSAQNDRDNKGILPPSVRGQNDWVDKKRIRIIGNIPYNITSPILFKLIDNREMISDALLMMQEEVARRLTAKPGTKEYGITSVFVQIFSKPKLLFKVSRNCFYPKPKVDSRMVSFDFETSISDKIENEEFFRKFVRTAFGKRRKTLGNALKDMDIDVKSSGIKFDFGRRAETLTPFEFIELSNKFYHRGKETQRKN